MSWRIATISYMTTVHTDVFTSLERARSAAEAHAAKHGVEVLVLKLEGTVCLAERPLVWKPAE